MCGISGIINKENNRIDESMIASITDIIKHRGPDDYGFYYDKNFAFGHRRLSIVDLSSDGHQPMHYKNRYVITFNGEIYNYIELKKELENYGYTFSSKTDTEVILAAYDKWGQNCVNYFNGMWSFALYDKDEQIIFCSRDRFGVKPFYYTDFNNLFIFGSEIKQLLLLKDKNYVNEKILTDYILFSISEHTNETFFKDIFNLPGGHSLIYNLSKHEISIKKYYDLSTKSHFADFTEKEAFKKFKEELERSVQLRLRSDVPVGTCLSGGLDSSSVAGIASEIYSISTNRSFIGIHAKSMETSSDESGYAKTVADFKGIDLSIITPDVDEFREAIDDVFYAQEEPFDGPSIFMQYFVMKKAKDLGCTVMLDGQGADEVMLGYERYFPAYFISLPFFKRFIAFFQAYNNSRLSIKQMLSFVLYFSFFPIRYTVARSRYWFIKKELLSDFSELKKLAKSYYTIVEMQKIELTKTQLPQLLRFEDKNSMAHSIECRLPFLDYVFVETALSLPGSFKIVDGWSKYILRKAMSGIIPEEILWRKNKLGFNAPDKIWTDSIREEMRKSIDDSIILKKISNIKIDANKLDDRKLWKFYSISKWEEIYKPEVFIPGNKI